MVTFQYKSDAEWFYEHLKHRMGHFGLSLEEEKSRLIEFGRYAKERRRKAGTKPGTFTFLGFTHYCSKSRNGRFRVKRKTSKKKFAKKVTVQGLTGFKKTDGVNWETVKAIGFLYPNILDTLSNIFSGSSKRIKTSMLMHWQR